MSPNTIANAEIEVSADWAQASSPLMWRLIGDDEWQSTPYQVADVRHDPERALRLVDGWLERNFANY